MALKDLKCSVCDGGFSSTHSAAKYCSRECRSKHYAKVTGRVAYGEKIATGTVGAIAEIAVAADLMKKGYAVFRALSPACAFDLVAFKNDAVLKIEVRTAYANQNGRLQYPAKLNGGGVDWFGLYERNTGAVTYQDAKTRVDLVA